MKSDENSLVQYSNIFRQAYTRSQTIEDFEKPNEDLHIKLKVLAALISCWDRVRKMEHMIRSSVVVFC